MSPAQIVEDEPRRPIWLITLADVMLLLVGFFVYLQANPTLDHRTLTASLREGFGIEAPLPIAVEANVVAGFGPGSAELPASDVALWAKDALRDPRTVIRVTGGTDGTSADVDAATGSAAILAADRARAVVAALSTDVPPSRLLIDTRVGAGRAVQLNLAFAGEHP
jgi:hypothetical protein